MASEVVVEKATINHEALGNELAAALPGRVTGVSTGRGRVTVHFRHEPTPEQAETARRIVEAHDAAALTARQRAERDEVEAARAAVEQLAAYVALENPTPAQRAAAVDALARVVLRLARRMR